MTPLTLTVRDRYRQAREVPVQISRFTIGSAAENNLVLEGLSERQAVIECFENIVEVTNSGAGSGMRVNGYSKSGTVRLVDGDVVSLGDAYELIVHLAEQNAGANTVPASSGNHPVKPVRRLSAPVIAVGLFLVLGAGVVLYSKVSSNAPDQVTPTPFLPPGRMTPVPSPTAASSAPEPTPTVSEEEQLLRQILVSARRTMECISYDGQGYPFPEDIELAIKGRVLYYQQQPERVAAALRTVSQHLAGLLDQSQNIVPDYPSLILYLVLAEVTANPAESPLAITRRLSAALPGRRIKSGNDAQSTLILVAGQRLNDDQWSLFNARISVPGAFSDPIRQRNVWWLYQQKKLSEESYQFVLDFLALSVIAQSPARWLSPEAPELSCVTGKRR